MPLILTMVVFHAKGQSYLEIGLEAGIDHYFYNIDLLGGGAAFFDYNNDGFDDLYLTGGSHPDKIYENNGDGTFKDVTESLGVSAMASIATVGVAAADLDNDGYPDLFISTGPGDRCYILWNKHGDSFELDGSSNGVDDEFFGSSIAVGDYDLDGDLDVYVGNYRTLTIDALYKNNGNRTFTNVNELIGERSRGTAWAVAFTDWDHDHDQDIMVANDFGNLVEPNRLFQNNYPEDSFTEISGNVDFDEEMNSMGIAVGDFDEDGDFDYYITDTGNNNFYVNDNGIFTDEAVERRVENSEGTSWGTAFIDYDNDTHLDLLVMNGQIGLKDGLDHENKLYRGNGTSFEDVSIVEGISNGTTSRGLAISDYDNDGAQDHIVAVIDDDEISGSNYLLYRNTGSNDANWIQFELQGSSANRDGYGSRITIEVDGRTLIQEQTGGSTFLSTHSKTRHFGLAENTGINRVTVTWPGGQTVAYANLAGNQKYRIVQDGGIYSITAQKVSLNEGETMFLEGEKRSTPGIYRDTLGISSPNVIRITKLDFGGGASNDGTDNVTEQSIARLWNELLLESIRNDFARPTVHARNLFHISAAMYDAFAAYHDEADTYFLGKTIGDFTIDFNGAVPSGEVQKAQEEAISYACYRLLDHRFKNSPGYSRLRSEYRSLMEYFGFDPDYDSTDYGNNVPAALGNYIAEQVILFGGQDGSNEVNDYANTFYTPRNSPLVVDGPGNPTIGEPNHWQPLSLRNFVDQSGNIIGEDTPAFLSPEWGKVVPYALKESDLDKYTKEGNEYWVYHDPGAPVTLKSDVMGLDDPYKWGFAVVAVWSSHLDPFDGKTIDVSPASIGNMDISEFPEDFKSYKDFYDIIEGRSYGKGHDTNPITGQPYEPQIVPKGDYTRVLAEFWADGPDSETPPGHWFTILNYVNDHPLTIKKFSGKGEELSDLEWDVKSYMALGGAMHDAAVTAWGIKGYYDYIRPISAIRYMASKGQSSDAAQPNFDPEGMPLIPDYIELVKEGDPLAGPNGEHIGKIKLYAWKGTHFVDDPDTDVAGVDWILAENWVPYQRPSFVTPPFAGYVSGHSTFSRAAAEVLTQLTGSKFFPGGMGIFSIKKNEFLVFEDGPSTDMQLQWATYQDASDQTSLSRIWGGIHPPIDDIAGRVAGQTIGEEAFSLSEKYFYEDKDGDGYYSYEDLDDNDGNVPGGETPKNLEYGIYPVPAKEKITLNIKDFEGRITAYFYNVIGAMVLSKTVDVVLQESDIPVQQLPSGLYLLVCTNANGEKIIAKKIIKR